MTEPMTAELIVALPFIFWLLVSMLLSTSDLNRK